MFACDPKHALDTSVSAGKLPMHPAPPQAGSPVTQQVPPVGLVQSVVIGGVTHASPPIATLLNWNAQPHPPWLTDHVALSPQQLRVGQPMRVSLARGTADVVPASVQQRLPERGED